MSRLSPWPVVAVGAIIWKQDRFLLIRRGTPPRKGGWSIPGGRQEAGETVQEAVCREIREETGIEIAITGLAAVVDLIDRDENGIKHHYTVIDMLAEWRSGEARAGDDATDVAWVRLEEIGDYHLPELQIKVIGDAHQQRLRVA